MGLFRSSSLTPGDLIEVAGAPVRLRVNARARRVSLRIDAAKREVIATAPSPRRLTEAVAFAGQRADWMARNLQALPQPVSLNPGDRLEVLGRAHILRRATKRLEAGFFETEDAGPVLAAWGQGDAFGRAVLRLLKRRALEVMNERTVHYAQTLGRPRPQVNVGDPKARWGSCRPPRTGLKADAGRIRYSWRLVLAPYAVADYVAAHECAHLLEANHGPRFWALVRQIHGPEKTARDWLKRHGARLHGFGR
ncbi:MAG TPA: SprT family zinc-dependent metalloprotease [Caulobacteraceae bacterium]|nr:SprT family zinc-dependent metalloprotease [Caulobacteraceae bacterium]